MIYPMLNTRKRKGNRGEALVAKMRARRMAKNARLRRVGRIPSQLHVSPTGTVQPKQFGAPRGIQPVVPAPILGGLRGAIFPES